MVVVSVAESLPEFESGVEVPTVPVLDKTVPPAMLGSTCTVRVNVVLSFGAMLAVLHEMDPVLPGVGVVQLQPFGTSSDLKVVPFGTASASVASAAAPGPAFETVMV